MASPALFINVGSLRVQHEASSESAAMVMMVGFINQFPVTETEIQLVSWAVKGLTGLLVVKANAAVVGVTKLADPPFGHEILPLLSELRAFGTFTV
jgi:hypothetical protein